MSTDVNTTVPYYFRPHFQCTLAYSFCSVQKYGYVHYIPSLAGNVLFLTIFALILLAQFYLLFRHRTWGVSTCFSLGLILEVLGYVGRLLIRTNPFLKSWFLLYLICLTIGPTLIAAGIYLCLARVVVVIDGGEKTVSRWRPRTYTLFFIGWDLASLVLQAIGGAIASLGSTGRTVNMGVHIMVAGLSVQVASLLLFMLLCFDLFHRVTTRKSHLIMKHDELYRSQRFKIFLYGLALGTVTIFIRSVFRVAELSKGFDSHLANNQISFMILDGTMVIIGSTTLTAFHPGWAFGRVWREANFRFRIRKQKEVEASEDVSGVESLKGREKGREEVNAGERVEADLT